MKLSTTKLLPETKRLAKQQAAARGLFLYEYLDKLVRGELGGETREKESRPELIMGSAIPSISHKVEMTKPK